MLETPQNHRKFLLYLLDLELTSAVLPARIAARSSFAICGDLGHFRHPFDLLCL